MKLTSKANTLMVNMLRFLSFTVIHELLYYTLNPTYLVRSFGRRNDIITYPAYSENPKAQIAECSYSNKT